MSVEDIRKNVTADPLDEVCPTCKAAPGHRCDLNLGATPKQTIGGNYPCHASRERKAVRRINREKKKPDTRREWEKSESWP